ncbi:pyridoxal phosphate-dependent decarboxylase family protein [Kitasatospora sp. NPDC058046]|uniref:pyridoxal phosphate-dependent decarboxylase family protein n=1 Tax=Kitasatospora sp. NPDC058046 TaxID=3346312 RepID=UPI0036D83C60
MDLLSGAPPEEPGDADALLNLAARAARTSVEPLSPRNMAYVPSGGLPSAMAAAMLTTGFNRVTWVPDLNPAMVAVEQGVMAWLCHLFSLPPSAVGTTHTGTSLATLTALTAARQDRLGDDLANATAYTTRHTHPVVLRALRITGLPADAVRTIPTTADLRMDPDAAAAVVREDRRAGRRPFLLIANAGTTLTGTIDPLAELADLASREELWLHVDAAYGGAFQLTDRGRRRLDGVHRADSITLDPHKGFFLPHGSGVLLVRDVASLHAAFSLYGDCLVDLHPVADLPTYSDLGPELTREYRGLRLWFPLHLHGLAAFRTVLDRMLDLALYAHQALARDSLTETLPYAPDLTVVPFRLRDADDTANRALLEHINATGDLFLSGAELDGRYVLRLCLLDQRLRPEHLDQALAVIRSSARLIQGGDHPLETP